MQKCRTIKAATKYVFFGPKEKDALSGPQGLD